MKRLLLLLLAAIAALFAGCSNSSGGGVETPTQSVSKTPKQIKFTKFSIPKAGVRKYGGGLYLYTTLWGENFPNNADENDTFLSDIRVTCESGPSIVADAEVSYNYVKEDIVMPNFLEIRLFLPENMEGNYDITVSYGEESITSTLSVKDYSEYKVGDVLLNDGSIIHGFIESAYYNTSDRLKAKTFSDDEKAKAVGVLCGFNSYGAPLGWLGLHNYTGGYEGNLKISGSSHYSILCAGQTLKYHPSVFSIPCGNFPPFKL